ncbi:MAG: DUF3598 family protein [Candidatus Obscuribacter sp.]|nr:DUF3598 family protein [Candidatus Obscuribacter sp.]
MKLSEDFLSDFSDLFYRLPMPQGSNANWIHFASQHVSTWQGRWTRYSPEGEVIEDFKSKRDFRFGMSDRIYTAVSTYPIYFPPQVYKAIDTDLVLQENTYYQEVERRQSWTLDRLTNSLPDGIYHPQAESQRGLFLPEIATWSCKELPCAANGVPYGMEIFFRHKALRFSVGIVFSDAGLLQRLAVVREFSLEEDKTFWSEDIEQQLPVLPEGSYSGWESTVTADLRYSRRKSSFTPIEAWQTEGDFKITALPDGILVRLPSTMKRSEDRVIEVLWNLEATPEAEAEAGTIYRARLSYDGAGRLESLTGGRLRRK